MIRTRYLAILLMLLLCGCRGIRPPSGVAPIERELTATGYCKCGKCCGWKRNWYGMPVHTYGRNKGKRKHIGMTASGKRVRRGSIAADTRAYPFGTIMHIEGYGYGRVEDRGGAIKGDHIDLFFPSHREARSWGKQTKTVKIWFPPSGRS